MLVIVRNWLLVDDRHIKGEGLEELGIEELAKLEKLIERSSARVRKIKVIFSNSEITKSI